MLPYLTSRSLHDNTAIFVRIVTKASCDADTPIVCMGTRFARCLPERSLQLTVTMQVKSIEGGFA